jgi:hypothetical protein
MHKLSLIIAVLPLFIWNACNQNPETIVPPSEVSKDTTELKPVTVPELNAESMYAYVAKQVSFGPRVPGTMAHQQCGDYLVATLMSFGPSYPKVTQQKTTATTFDNKLIPVRNIIAAFYPDRGQRILLAAHWDTRPFAEMDKTKPHKPIDGANDGASGVGVLLEIARHLAANDPGIGVDIIFFDAEDWGDTSGMSEDSYCLGSQYWAKNPHVADYYAQYGILLDMVGGKDALFAIEENSWRFAKPVVQKVWNTAKNLGFGDLFIDHRRGPIIDDHFYVMKYRQFPMIDIINYDPKSYSRFGHFWHTHEDNMENIDPNVLYAVGKTVMHVVYQDGAKSKK